MNPGNVNVGFGKRFSCAVDWGRMPSLHSFQSSKGDGVFALPKSQFAAGSDKAAN